MSNIGMTCDVCGRTVQGCTFVNGMKFCAKCYQETFGEKVNQCNYCSFKSVNDMLAEKMENLKEEISKLKTQKKQLEWDNINQPYAEYHKMIKHQQEAIEHYFKETVVLKKALELACGKIEFMAQMLGQTLDYNVEENLIEQAKENIK